MLQNLPLQYDKLLQNLPLQYDVLQNLPLQYDKLLQNLPLQYGVLQNLPLQYKLLQNLPLQYKLLQNLPLQYKLLQNLPLQYDKLKYATKLLQSLSLCLYFPYTLIMYTAFVYSHIERYIHGGDAVLPPTIKWPTASTICTVMYTEIYSLWWYSAATYHQILQN